MNLDESKLRILHVTNFNVRHNGRLFYNTGRRINNGLLKLGHTVQTLSDRDTVSQERKITDVYGSKSLNEKLLDIVGNYKPNLIIFGHADAISNDTLIKIKNFYPSIKVCQWFLDKMDNKDWSVNKQRFEKKIHLMDSNFCTTCPKALKLNKGTLTPHESPGKHVVILSKLRTKADKSSFFTSSTLIALFGFIGLLLLPRVRCCGLLSYFCFKLILHGK